MRRAGRRLTGPPHRTIARASAGPRCNFQGGSGVHAPTRPTGPAPGVFVRLRAFRSKSSLDVRRAGRALAVFALAVAALGPTATQSAAAEGLSMEARILLNGNARIGSWMAVQVHLVNNGPAVAGELRLAGGSQGRRGSGRSWTCRPSRTRPTSCTRSRRRSGASSRSCSPPRREGGIDQGEVSIHDENPASWSRSSPSVRADRHQQSPSPAEPEPARTAGREHHPRRSPRARRGLEPARPDRLAGRRRTRLSPARSSRCAAG